MNYRSMSRSEQMEELQKQQANLEVLKAKGLKLDMSRGKPGKAQLDLVSDILTVLTDPADCIVDGTDVRNYGILAGLPAAKALFADVLGCKPEECFIGGTASLTLMYDTIAKAYTHGLLHSEKPWCKLDKVKFLCPAPGYDRHFKITESFGFELITVEMTPDGPDMDQVEELVKDPEVKGIWCVPKYSNPDGIIYSEETIRRFAHLKPAAPDFVLMWDNAYCVHEFDGDYVPFPDIISLCREAGNPDMVFEYASTSKITFPGAGISVMAASEANQKYMQKLLGIQMISYDKVNQLRHVKYLKNKEGTIAVMKKHAGVLGPKFKMVLDTLEREIAPLGIAEWQKPKGGYFVSVNTMDGIAKRTLALCKEAGVVMTSAGATFPYGKDPRDRNIRVAPSLPPVSELEQAMEVFCVSMKIAALEKLLTE
ncbi:MAG: aminotransferase class I/II-fold pyridoxal phosphate-dependent enzyme [Oscillospiraceae bacterium]|nr:aminotransferase class I/II-fold pyridoxal phosphate-dependent enzyme [Oscillospiraceae bacterium]MBR2703805.1 aminotransferase class I/II-fold pyridoxal phosphate-dependent enzyme [Oscillospiraceae bacterium]MBR2800844.1 aminotransferase class I/II-fold pyridoxal phosphate-dependent enzyme [Oscillospiraceae bacterium]MBR2807681.1 aminotransferase class I/II-fold pyridoxal phosphate-dependent enzyme [Oscillospiraceae bacterium]MBR4552075.1 aminotransferase class I/II-fold pyridoxal phosphate